MMKKTKDFQSAIIQRLDMLTHVQNMTPIVITKKIHLDSRNDIWTLPTGVKVYVPMYPWDYIQQIIVESDNFFESNILNYCARYIPEGATILDIGANIGNHSLYWATMCNAKRIHAFEPLVTSYEYLCKNIEINNLQDIIIPHNIALGYREDIAKIQKNYSNNIGMTSLTETKTKNKYSIPVQRLDDLDLGSDKIDFVKIDVEGFELKTLAGMRNILEKHRPVVLIETFVENRAAVLDFFKGLRYQEADQFEDSNYLFSPA